MSRQVRGEGARARLYGPALWAALALIWLGFGVAILAYSAVRSLGDEIMPVWDIAPIERAIWAGSSPVHALQSQVYNRDLVVFELAALVAHMMWFWLAPAVGVVIMFRHRERLPEYFTWVLVPSFLACLLFLLVPVEPPWLADDDVVRILREQSFVQYVGADNNAVAAMPSLHAGLPAVIALFLWRRTPTLRPLSIGVAAYALIIGVAVVYLGEHWALDVVAGVLLAPATGYLIEGRHGLRNLDRLPGAPATRMGAWCGRLAPHKEPDESCRVERLAA